MNFRRGYVLEMVAKRKGECGRHGCCDLSTLSRFRKCLDPQDRTNCLRWNNLPFACSVYPFDEKDKILETREYCNFYWEQEPAGEGTRSIRKIREKKIHVGIQIALALAVFLIFGQILGHDFVSFDDGLYVTDNAHVQSGLTWEGVKWAFTDGTRVSNCWHPLTWLSHMADCQLFGLNPMGHHLSSLLLHLACSLLLYRLFAHMTGRLWRSAFVAALFAFHPLHVESVAWIAERKDVLSIFFWLLTMTGYVAYAKKPGARSYFLVLFFFMLGLMSKPMVVTLPFVLLLMDFWPLGRLNLGQKLPDQRPVTAEATMVRLVYEKIPLFVLTGVASASVFWTEKIGGALGPMEGSYLRFYAANALFSYVDYLGKTLYPLRLAAFYPYPTVFPVWKVVFCIAVLSGLSWLFVRSWRRNPELAVGWFWYLGTLVPVIGLVQAGDFAMADRYTYVTLIGIFLLSWGIPDRLPDFRHRRIWLVATSLGILLMLAPIARIQAGYWKNSETLFRHALDVTEDNWLAHDSLGLALLNRGNVDDAIIHFRKALKIKPDYVVAYNNLGTALVRKGKLDEAFACFETALSIWPDHPTALYNVGRAFFSQGDYEKAEFYFRKVLSVRPGDPAALTNLGIIHEKRNEYDQALKRYTEALKAAPNRAEVHFNLGKLLLNQGDTEQGIEHVVTALVAADPDLEAGGALEFADVFHQIGTLLVKAGKSDAAAVFFDKASQLAPGIRYGQKPTAPPVFREE